MIYMNKININNYKFKSNEAIISKESQIDEFWFNDIIFTHLINHNFYQKY